MNIVDALYEAAAHAGFLKRCSWSAPGSGTPETHEVGFRAPDVNLLDGLSVSTEYEMFYPAVFFKGLKAHDKVEIEGVLFQVREVRSLGDGAELCVKLAKV